MQRAQRVALGQRRSALRKYIRAHLQKAHALNALAAKFGLNPLLQLPGIFLWGARGLQKHVAGVGEI